MPETGLAGQSFRAEVSLTLFDVLASGTAQPALLLGSGWPVFTLLARMASPARAEVRRGTPANTRSEQTQHHHQVVKNMWRALFCASGRLYFRPCVFPSQASGIRIALRMEPRTLHIQHLNAAPFPTPSLAA